MAISWPWFGRNLSFMSGSRTGTGVLALAAVCPVYAVIIKNCAHDKKETDMFDDGFGGSPRWQGGAGRGWAGNLGRVRDQAHREEDPAALPGQDFGGFCRFHGRCLLAFQPVRVETRAISWKYRACRGGIGERLAHRQVPASPGSSVAGLR